MLVVPLIILVSAWASTLVAADCPQTTAIETLNVKSLEGKWYELSSFGTVFSHGLDRCQVITITAGTDDRSFTVANDRINKMFNNHVKSEWTVEANGDKVSGDLTLKFKMPLVGSISIPLKVLGTDEYKNYVIFHACHKVASIFKFNSGFILTKKRHYDDKELENIYKSIDEDLKKNGLSRSQFSLSNQINCDDKSSTPSNTDTATSAATSPAASQTTDTSSEDEKSASDSKKAADSDTEKTAAAETTSS